MTWVRETQHEERAFDSAAGPFQVPDMAKLLAPIAAQLQYLENASWQVFDARFLENATDRSLVLLGAAVGEPPLGDSEEDFKLRITLKLRAIRSNHGDLDFFELLSLIVGSVWTVEDRPGYVLCTQNSGTPISSSVIFRMLKLTSGDGVLVRCATYEDGTTPMTWGSFDATITGADWSSFDATITGADWAGTRQQ